MKTFLSFWVFGILWHMNALSTTFTTVSNGPWNDGATWGNTSPCTAGVDYPSTLDKAIINGGFDVTVNSVISCSDMEIFSHSNTTSLTISSGSLTVSNRTDLYSTGNGHVTNIAINAPFNSSNFFGLLASQSNIVNISGSSSLTCTYLDLRGYVGGAVTYNLTLSSLLSTTVFLFNNGTGSSITTNLNCSTVVSTLWLQSSTASSDCILDTRFSNCDITVNSTLKNGTIGGTILADGTNGIFTMTGPSFSVLPSYSFPSLIINNNLSLNNKLSVSGTLTINSSKSLNSNTQQIELSGNMVNNGTLTQSSGDNFTFNGSSAQTISGSSKTTFEDLIINNSNGVTISSDTVNVNGSLELLNGTLTTGGKLKLLDAGTGIAPIKTIQGTGAISGEVTAQFYLGTSGNPLTKVDYRQLAIPLSGIQISDVQYNASTCPKCFYTYGFTGSNYPNVSWISFYKYDNTISMSRFGDGYIGPTSTSEPLEYKQGILFNGGPGTNGQSSYFMELSGEINSGNITLSTANGAKMNSNANQSFRYALVGNPYLSEITLSAGDFTSCGEGSGAMWVYEPDNGGYNTAKNTISPFQSFWVLMDASGTPSISITESDKTGSKASTLKSQSATNNQLIVKLKQTNSKTNLNYAAIRFNDQATNNMDYGYDVSDFQNPYPLPDISLVSEDDELLSTYVNSNDIDHVIIPIRTNTHFSGQHSITVDNLDQFDGCYMLEDKFENKLISLTATNNSYDFFLADTTKGIRFVLHKYNLVKKLETTNSTCFGDDNGSAELTLVNHGGTAPDKVQWLTSNGSLILDDYQAKGRSALNNLKAGNYSIAFESGTLNCAASKSFTIFEPGEMAPEFNLGISRNEVGQNEEIEFINTSTGDILTYTLDFGDGFTSSEIAPKHTYTQVGIYEVSLTASNGNSDCNVSSNSTVKVIESETTFGLEEVLSNAGFNYVVANDILRLAFTEDLSQDTPLKIISLQGQELMNHEILKGANSYQMDISSLPTIFLLQFDGESSFKSIKIAK